MNRVQLLVAAVHGIAQERGAWLPANDALQAAVVKHCPDDASRSYWSRAPASEIAGNLAHTREIAELLEARGVAVWANPVDDRIRIVNTNWLVAHADKRAFVTAPGPTGYRCRFGRMRENDQVQELVALEPEQRGALETRNGRQQLQPATIYTHERCRPHWQRWVEIAEFYATQADADAAEQGGRQDAPRRPRGRAAAGHDHPVPRSAPAESAAATPGARLQRPWAVTGEQRRSARHPPGVPPLLENEG